MTDIQAYFEKTKDTHEGFKANCPRCDDKTMVFHWNTEKGVGCCHHAGCPWYAGNGGIYESRLRAFFGDSEPYENPEKIIESGTADVKLPEEFQVLSDLDSGTFAEVYNYLRSRHLTRRAIESSMLGYCKSGKMWGYIIIPVFENGEVTYWQGRRFKNRDRKFFNPVSSRKSHLLYELASIRRPERVVLVESAINALTLDDGQGRSSSKIFALLGSSLSEQQFNKILLYEKYARELVIALDPDAWRKSVEIARRFSRVIPSVKLAKFPKKTDINNLGREESWEIIDHAILYKRENHLQILQSDAV
jgi:hypothetical protein